MQQSTPDALHPDYNHTFTHIHSDVTKGTNTTKTTTLKVTEARSANELVNLNLNHSNLLLICMKPFLFCLQTDQQTPVKQPPNIPDNLE